MRANATRLLVHTPFPADLLPYFNTERMDAPASEALTAGEFRQACPATVSAVSAAVCLAVRLSPRGYSNAELLEAFCDATKMEANARIEDRLRSFMSYYLATGLVTKWIEIMQDSVPGRAGCDTLCPVVVYGKGPFPSTFEAFNGHRDANCPKAFRGEIVPSRLHQEGARYFVNTVQGPIRWTAAFRGIEASVLASCPPARLVMAGRRGRY